MTGKETTESRGNKKNGRKCKVLDLKNLAGDSAFMVINPDRFVFVLSVVSFRPFSLLFPFFSFSKTCFVILIRYNLICN